ncbi:MAG: MBL fold metallo-hydrolase [Balneolaceae bacterium]|nr:MBL fold metallo-hydrolase [Balneolaceae bacterium]MBO6546661.1 MBL fold metallo-hydrolase [Balneolaceae bacterium]MBO6649019.1 MBL fold metallo-hydrolase [Balneolaceae bacterium]
MKKLLYIFKITMTIFIGFAVLLVFATFLYMKQAKFGKTPNGEHLDRISQSSNYSDGMFKNLSVTPDLSEGHSYWSIIKDQFFTNHPRTEPKERIPSNKTDLFTLDEDENVLVWFGHSSYFIQLDGIKILVDPVFSGNASPIPGTVKSFPGTDRYTPEDIPEVDYLIISHDHYDHLDYKTIKALEAKVKNVICGLGVGSHFQHWGYSEDKITEKDWNETVEVDSGFTIHALPARHFSGRGFTRKNTLWASYLIESPSMKIYVGGDSGYDSFFKEIGNQFGEIDLVILDNGQYNDAWKEIHLHPEQVLQAAHDLNAKQLFPVHSSKYVLAMHPWDEPLNRVKQLNENNENPISLFTPIIGTKIDLNDSTTVFTSWWEGIE